jgi:hypothetical protein
MCFPLIDETGMPLAMARARPFNVRIPQSRLLITQTRATEKNELTLKIIVATVPNSTDFTE